MGGDLSDDLLGGDLLGGDLLGGFLGGDVLGSDLGAVFRPGAFGFGGSGLDFAGETARCRAWAFGGLGEREGGAERAITSWADFCCGFDWGWAAGEGENQARASFGC